MFRFITNVFLIIIIAFSASVIPLNLNLFHLSERETMDQVEINYYDSNIPQETQIINPTTMQFIVNTDISPDEPLLPPDYDLTLEIFRGDNLISAYSNEDILIDEVSINEKLLSYNLDISQENLNLSKGYYNLKIYTNHQDFSEVTPYEFRAVYLDDSIYIPAKNDVESGYMYLTLYFPDNNVMYSIPVSRKIPHTRNTISATVSNLHAGPKKGLGLSEGSPVPEVNGISIRNGTATLNLPNDLGIYDQGSAMSQSALNSFINSITSIYEVDRVMFLQNSKVVEVMFHGTYMKEPFEANDSPKIYLGYDKDQRVLLAPIQLENISSDLSKEDLILEIFDSLKTSMVNDFIHKDLVPTIPENVELLDFEIVDKTLILNLSDDVLQAFEDRKDLQSMMIDSILYSFTSIPDINKIQIKMNGEGIESLGNIDLSQEMVAPRYINIE